MKKIILILGWLILSGGLWGKSSDGIAVGNSENVEIRNYERIKVVREKTGQEEKTKVSFFDARGNHIKTLPLQKSEKVINNKDYALIYGRWGFKEKPTKISVYNNNGNPVWEKKDIVTGGKSGILACELSPTGQVAMFYGDVGHSSYGEIYDSNGEKLGKITREDLGGDIKDGKALYKAYPSYGIGFFANGDLVLVGNVNDTITKKFSDFAVFCYEKNGKIKWIYNLKTGQQVPQIRVKILSMSDIVIVENTYNNAKYLYVIDKDGGLVYERNLNKFVDAPIAYWESFKIKVIQIDENESNIGFSIGYKNIVKKFNIDLVKK